MRKMVSVALAITFIIVSISGILLHGKWRKPQSNEIDKSIVKGTTIYYPKKTHQWSGFAFIILGTIHAFFNGKRMLSYIKIFK